MSVVLAANVFGVDVPVESVTSYYTETDGTWTADVVLAGSQYSAFVPVANLSVYVRETNRHYYCDICDNLPYGVCDKHAN